MELKGVRLEKDRLKDRLTENSLNDKFINQGAKIPLSLLNG